MNSGLQKGNTRLDLAGDEAEEFLSKYINKRRSHGQDDIERVTGKVNQVKSVQLELIQRDCSKEKR